MILRSVIEHVKTQNWTAIWIDLLIVVFGVFIGIQVANWNDGRLARQREQTYLVELQSDFYTIKERAVGGMSMYENNIEVIRRMRDGIRAFQAGERPEDLKALATDLTIIMAGRVPAGRSPFYTEIIASGQLATIQNRELRRELTAYDDASRIGSEGFRVLRDQLLPAIHHTLKYSNGEINLNPEIENEFVTESADIVSFLTDPETPGMLSIAMSVYGNMHLLHRSQEERASKILGLIEDELIKQ